LLSVFAAFVGVGLITKSWQVMFSVPAEFCRRYWTARRKHEFSIRL